MKFLFLLALLSISTTFYAQSSEEIVHNFFKALNQKNIPAIDRMTIEDLKLHSFQPESVPSLNISTKKDFIDGLKAIPENMSFEEKIFDIKSIETEYLAQYTVPYKFFINGELSHFGTNVLTLIKKDNHWMISYIADTRIKP
ncbi:MAG: DUF4829 domain-containing protein [Bacteroidetes bacterium]|jgi:hypothetical protein|nr:DUF4829 domain-containing protein [Bacteroidota bacterium]